MKVEKTKSIKQARHANQQETTVVPIVVPVVEQKKSKKKSKK